MKELTLWKITGLILGLHTVIIGRTWGILWIKAPIASPMKLYSAWREYIMVSWKMTCKGSSRIADAFWR